MSLVFKKSSGQDGAPLFLSKDQKLKIGRDEINNLRIRKPDVDTEHAILRVLENGDVSFTHLSSIFSTWLDGIEMRPSKTIILKDKQVVTISDREFRYDAKVLNFGDEDLSDEEYASDEEEEESRRCTIAAVQQQGEHPRKKKPIISADRRGSVMPSMQTKPFEIASKPLPLFTMNSVPKKKNQINTIDTDDISASEDSSSEENIMQPEPATTQTLGTEKNEHIAEPENIEPEPLPVPLQPSDILTLPECSNDDEDFLNNISFHAPETKTEKPAQDSPKLSLMAEIQQNNENQLKLVSDSEDEVYQPKKFVAEVSDSEDEIQPKKFIAEVSDSEDEVVPEKKVLPEVSDSEDEVEFDSKANAPFDEENTNEKNSDDGESEPIYDPMQETVEIKEDNIEEFVEEVDNEIPTEEAKKMSHEITLPVESQIESEINFSREIFKEEIEEDSDSESDISGSCIGELAVGLEKSSQDDLRESEWSNPSEEYQDKSRDSESESNERSQEKSVDSILPGITKRELNSFKVGELKEFLESKKLDSDLPKPKLVGSILDYLTEQENKEEINLSESEKNNDPETESQENIQNEIIESEEIVEESEIVESEESNEDRITSDMTPKDLNTFKVGELKEFLESKNLDSNLTKPKLINSILDYFEAQQNEIAESEESNIEQETQNEESEEIVEESEINEDRITSDMTKKDLNTFKVGELKEFLESKNIDSNLTKPKLINSILEYFETQQDELEENAEENAESEENEEIVESEENAESEIVEESETNEDRITSDMTKKDLNTFKVGELKEFLESKNLDSNLTKPKLINSILDYFETQQNEQENTEENEIVESEEIVEESEEIVEESETNEDRITSDMTKKDLNTFKVDELKEFLESKSLDSNLTKPKLINSILNYFETQQDEQEDEVVEEVVEESEENEIVEESETNEDRITSDMTKKDLNTFKVDELKEFLESKNLDSNLTKPKLINSILNYFETQQDEQEDEVVESEEVVEESEENEIVEESEINEDRITSDMTKKDLNTFKVGELKEFLESKNLDSNLTKPKLINSILDYFEAQQNEIDQEETIVQESEEIIEENQDDSESEIVEESEINEDRITSDMTVKDLNTFKVGELKEFLESKDLDSNLTKPKLINSILDYFETQQNEIAESEESNIEQETQNEESESSEQSQSMSGSQLSESDLNDFTFAQLKQYCNEKNLDSKGTKKVLISRILKSSQESEESEVSESGSNDLESTENFEEIPNPEIISEELSYKELNKLKIDDLKQFLEKRELDSSGTKAKLAKRILDYYLNFSLGTEGESEIVEETEESLVEENDENEPRFHSGLSKKELNSFLVDELKSYIEESNISIKGKPVKANLVKYIYQHLQE